MNQSSQQTIDLSPTEVLNEYILDQETAHVTETSFKMGAQLLVPYDVNIVNDGGPVGYWRLNENLNILTAVDSSFETGVGTWTGSTATISSSTTQAQTGTHSLKVAATGANAGAISGQYYGNGNGNLIPGVVYAGSCWIFSTTASRSFTMSVIWLDVTGATISTSTSAVFTPTVNTWQQLIFNFAAPSNAFAFKLQVKGTNSVNLDIYYMDNVQFFQIGYDSNCLTALSWPNSPYTDNPVTGTTGSILPAQTGPLTYPSGGTYPDSIKFTTSTDALTIPNASQLQIIGDFSAEFWLLTNGALSGSNTNKYSIISKNSDTAEFSVFIDGAGGLWYGHNGISAIQLSTNAVSNGSSWQHIVVTRSFASRTVVGYVNGVATSPQTWSVLPAITTNAVVIGNGPHPALTNGFLAEVALYARALTSTQVTNHYHWSGRSLPAGLATPGGYGARYVSTGGNLPSQYGGYGYAQYAASASPGNAAYDSGYPWGTFVWG